MALVDLSGPAIRPGESLSDPLDCRGGTILRVTMPADWTPANLSFKVASAAEGPWGDLFDVDGAELIVPCRPGATVMLKNQPPGALTAMAFIRFRSGSRDYPVKQAGDELRIFLTTIDDGKGPSTETPPPPDLPSVVDKPAIMVDGHIVPTCAVGAALTCTVGNWNGEPSSYWKTWLADSAAVGDGDNYTVQPADAGKSIACAVTATNAAGSTNVMSNVVAVDAA